MSEPPLNEKAFLERVDTRLRVWRRLCVIFLFTYFLLGTASVTLSALAATDLISSKNRQICSVVSAICVALLGFLRPDARYRNLIRAWRELAWEKTRYLFGATEREPLIQSLARTERMATDDQHHGNEPDASKLLRLPGEFDGHGRAAPVA